MGNIHHDLSNIDAIDAKSNLCSKVLSYSNQKVVMILRYYYINSFPFGMLFSD